MECLLCAGYLIAIPFNLQKKTETCCFYYPHLKARKWIPIPYHTVNQ